MKIIQLQQGSNEWHALRARITRCASYAPIMMGCHPNVRRDDLVRIFATGDEREISDFVREVIFANGHKVEAMARPIVEAEIGEDLYPVTATDDEGKHLASFDGLTMGFVISFEHKQWNEDLAAEIERKVIPDYVRWQLDHQLLVGRGEVERAILVCSDGTTEKRAKIEYLPDPARWAKLLAGWEQFEEDVRNYQHVEVPPRAVAEPQVELPIPAIEVKGEVAITSNLTGLHEQLRAYIEKIPAAPATDQDFANCEAACKALKTAEERLELAEATALARFADIDEMRSMIATMKALARDRRLATEKLVEARKKTIRAEILQDGQRAYDGHIRKLNERLGRPLLSSVTAPNPDFATAMKGKKTIEGLRNAVNTALAHAKIAANEIADRVEANLKYLGAQGIEYQALFADVSTIAFKEREHFELVVRTRIEEHKTALKKRADEAAEAAREKIAAEERAKAEAALAATKPAAPIFPPEERKREAPTARTEPPAPYVVPGRAEPERPVDMEIVLAVANAFHVKSDVAIAWLREIDFAALERRQPAAQAA